MKEASKNKVATPEQIDAWKKEYGGVFLLQAHDGKIAYVHDPFHSFLILKKATQGLMKSPILFTESIINDCWLQGDEAIKDEDKYLEGLKSEIDEIARIPNATFTKEGSNYRLECEGKTLVVRTPKRADVRQAEQYNRLREPYETEVALLKIICQDKKEVYRLSQENTRAYVGMLVVLEDLKEQVHLEVKKL